MTIDEHIHEVIIRGSLDYDPDTGIMTWKRRNSVRIKVGQIAGHVCKNRGYRTIRVNNKSYLAHRLAFVLMGESVPKYVDHANGLKDDNRWCNLRPANFGENQHNRFRQKNNTSGYKGVTWDKRLGKWKSQIMVNRSNIHLGLFDCPKEAHKAYCGAAETYFGEYKNYG